VEGSEKVLPDLMPFKLKFTPAAAREKVQELDDYLYVCGCNRAVIPASIVNTALNENMLQAVLALPPKISRSFVVNEFFNKPVSYVPAEGEQARPPSMRLARLRRPALSTQHLYLTPRFRWPQRRQGSLPVLTYHADEATEHVGIIAVSSATFRRVAGGFLRHAPQGPTQNTAYNKALRGNRVWQRRLFCYFTPVPLIKDSDKIVFPGSKFDFEATGVLCNIGLQNIYKGQRSRVTCSFSVLKKLPLAN
jgi:hypothetical protein